MDTQRELSNIMHRFVRFEAQTYTSQSSRILSLTLYPLNRTGMKWIERHDRLIRYDLRFRLCVSRIEVEIKMDYYDRN